MSNLHKLSSSFYDKPLGGERSGPLLKSIDRVNGKDQITHTLGDQVGHWTLGILKIKYRKFVPQL